MAERFHSNPILREGWRIALLIIQRYLLRECGTTFLGVSLLLVLVYLSTTFIQVFGHVAEGDYPASAAFEIFLLKGVGNLVFILPLSLFLAILLALGRLYKDSEMAAMFGCGIGPAYVFKAVASLAGIVSILLAILVLFFAPWSEQRASAIIDEASRRSQLENLEEKRFNMLDSGAVIYAEGIDGDSGHINRVFSSNQSAADNDVIISSRSGRIDVERDNKYLVLEQGHRYHGTPGIDTFDDIRFDEHGLLLKQQVGSSKSLPRYAISSGTLWRIHDRPSLEELHWRIAVPISAFILAIFAVPLSKTSPRQGRYGRIGWGILLYVVYNNLLTVGRSMIAKESVPIEVGLWWVHALALFLLTMYVWSQRRVRRPKAARLAAS